MRRFIGPIVAVFLAASAISLGTQEPDVKGFKTGATPTPFLKVVAAIKAGDAKIYKATAPPPQIVVVPKRLSIWGNNQFGDCVTAESCFAIADYSTFIGLDEIFVTEASCIKWARDHGVLNGADLLSVIQGMQRDGIPDEKGIVRKAGNPSSVDYSNEVTLQSAIAQGPVSIAIGSGSLPSGAGSRNGWYVFGSRRTGADHCVSLCGYGPTVELFKALGASPPPNAPANGYLLFTWGTIGVVDHKWLLSTCVEAWVRNPTTTDLQPAPQPPPTDKVVVAVADVEGGSGSAVKFLPIAKGGKSPYIFNFDYGDGSPKDGSGSHAYKAPGKYTVTVIAVDSTGQIGTTTCVATIGSGPGPEPTPGPGLSITLPQDTPAGRYLLVSPADLDEIQRRIDAIRGLKINKGR